VESHQRRPLTLLRLLKPYSALLLIAFTAAIGEGAADLLGPWPLKLVFDGILRQKETNSWLDRLVYSTFGTDKLALLKLAAISALLRTPGSGARRPSEA